MFYHMFATAAALTLTLLVGPPALAFKDVGESTHDGKVVSVAGEKVTMTDKDGKEHSHALAPEAKICLDGKAIKIEHLKAGMWIRVTIRDDNKDVAIRIEALENNKEFSTTQDGKVISQTGDKLVMSNKEGKEITCTLTGDARVTIDGKVVRVEDLKAGTRVRVTVLGDGKQLTSQIEAIVNNENFDRRS
jgi:hypothetical protein